MPTFTPPTSGESVGGDRLFSRYRIPVGKSVVKVNGVFTLQPFPWLGDLEGLEEGTEWFQGGRTYVIDDATAAALEAAGFTTDADAGYGVAPYGTEGYGF